MIRFFSSLLVFAFLLASASGASGSDEAFTFAVTGDSRGRTTIDAVNVPVLTRVFNEMGRVAPDFCLFVGDMVLGGFVDDREFGQQLKVWTDAASSFNAPIYIVPGNHEMRRGPGRDRVLQQMFPALPSNGPAGGPKAGNYYFDYHGSRFISVLADHEDWRIAIDQKWLDEVLDSSVGFKHIFVMSHHPMQQMGGVEGEFWQSLRRHHVDAYFCGHWHIYNRSQPDGSGTWQIIVGTAGAPPPPIFPKWLLNGTTVVDQFGFATVNVRDSSVDVTFHGWQEGSEDTRKPIDNFIISANTNDNPKTYSRWKDTLVEMLARPSAENRVPFAEETRQPDPSSR